MSVVSDYLKHPAMQYVGLLAYITTPNMQTHHSVKTMDLPNQQLTLQGKLYTQLLCKTINTPLL